ncbi:polysaccharide pyruvyl transferase family protein [Sphingomonas hylomeconis]|uniref:Polysaccharide pyruvyl transferase family protein n=1 Tax=Sphingomonas hylomeconis TaxID=1395958 RepID=A0ABV7STI9_9SPHN|nr:polysaccharide pyruvyl transferase family protein [Sphingomonas hylomeconis]
MITKVVTQNQGNQALSRAWLATLEANYPERRVVPLERAPSYLKRFTLAQLERAGDPITRFKEIAADLARQASSAGPAHYPARTEIRHKSSITQPLKTARLRQLLKVRSRLSSLGLGRAEYRKRLAQIRDAGMLVMNPAGEFFPQGGETVLIYLLELRVAQLLGVPTVMVNLSFEVENPLLRRLAAYVMDQCHALEFRDDESAAAYREAGGVRSAAILPDAALLTPPPAAQQAFAGGATIALAINALQVRAAGLDADWIAFFDRLGSEGFDPVLTSNEWTTDEPFWADLLQGGKVRSEGREADCSEYVALLGRYDVVVSSRLHTCVLAIIAGTPVVPVETGTFKLTGFFKQIGLDTAPIKLGAPGWQDLVVDRIREAQRDRAAVVSRQSQKRDAAALRLRSGLSDLFGSVVPR